MKFLAKTLLTTSALLTTFLTVNLTRAAPIESTSVNASQDTWIRNDTNNNGTNYGGSPRFAIGGLPSGEGRALLSFDLSSFALPENATFVSASLELYFIQDTPSAQTSTLLTINVYELTRSFTEGVLDGGGSDVSATWLRYGSDTWATPGGDYNLAVLASTNISTTASNGINTWSGEGLSSLVSTALENGSTINLLLKAENLTSGQRQLLWFGTAKENLAASLVIDYTVIPEPSTNAALAAFTSLVIATALRRRRSSF